MSEDYFIPGAAAQSKFTEKKSRFISHLWPVASEEEARARIEEMRKTYYDARHNCWCYLLREGATATTENPKGLRGSPC